MIYRITLRTKRKKEIYNCEDWDTVQEFLQKEFENNHDIIGYNIEKINA